MSKYGADSFAVLLVDGYNLIASLSEAASMGKESITSQTNGFGAASEQHSPIGIEKGMLSQGGGFFDTATDALHTALGGISQVSRIIVAVIEGNVIGKHFMGFEGAYNQKYEVIDARDNLVRANVTYLVNGQVDEGVLVQHLATFTADWDTKTGGANATDAPVDYTLDNMNRSINLVSNSVANPTVVTTEKAHGLATGAKVLIAGVTGSTPTINGERTVTVTDATHFTVPVNVTVGGSGGTIVRANSPSGGVGYLQVNALSGFSGVDIKIMHSPDDVTYAALVTFATVTTAPNKERKVVAGTVDRYLSNNGDVTGSGSVSVLTGFARY